jgi:hypothetical protein
MPVVAQPVQLPNIVRQAFGRMIVERIDMRNVFDLRNGLSQPAAVQAILVEVLAYIREVTLRRLVMAAVGERPYVMMLDVMQIFLRSFDDAMRSTPIVFLGADRTRCGQNRSSDGEI